MLYLVSCTIDNITYARQSGTRWDAVTTMREANQHYPEQFYKDAIETAANSLAASGSNIYTCRIATNIVLTVIAP